MKQGFRNGILGVMTALLAVGLTGCKTVSSESVPASSEKIHLRYGITGWKNHEALLKSAGLDNFNGYDVEYFVFQGGNLCIEALAANQIDFTGTSEIPPISASMAQNGGNFKIVLINSSSPQNQEVVALEKSGIKSIADLKGKKVGYIKNTTAHYFLNEMLKKEGLSWKDIEPVEITTADGVTALTGGQIDAFASYGNSINASKANGAVTIASAVNILSGNFPFEISDVVLKDEAKVDAIADYFARVQKSYEWAEDHLEEWAKIQAEPTGNTYDEAYDLLKRTYDDRGYLYHFVGIDDQVVHSEQNVADSFYELNVLDQKVDVSSFYEKSFYEKFKKALADLE